MALILAALIAVADVAVAAHSHWLAIAVVTALLIMFVSPCPPLAAGQDTPVSEPR